LDGQSYSKCADIHKFKAGKEVGVDRLGCLNMQELYALIKEGKPIALKNVYIEEFSLDQYRKDNGLDTNAVIEFHSFNAENCFFNATRATDLSYSLFTEGLMIRNCWFHNGDVLFHNAKFPEGKVDFSNTDFGDGKVSFQFSEFKSGDVEFNNCHFNGAEVSFVNTHFGDGHVSFENTDFGQADVVFHFARFGAGNVDFEKAVFNGANIDFRKVEFGSGRSNFRRVKFGDGEISFKEAEFNLGRVTFKSSQFGKGTLSFEMVDFGEEEVVFEGVTLGSSMVHFGQIKCGRLNLQGTHLDNYVDLRVSKASYIDLSDTVVRDIIDLKPVSHDVQIKSLNINGMRNLGRIYIDWYLNQVEELILSQDDTTLFQKAKQFNVLKQDFNNTGKYEQEDKAYVMFKRYERKAEMATAREKGSLETLKFLPANLFKRIVFDWMGLYATDPLRVLVSMVAVYILFSLGYVGLELIELYDPSLIHADVISSIGDPDKLNLWEKSFYHSAITYLTIGYGDYYPSGHIRWISSVQGFVGLFFMAYFTVAFVRKILR
jgi:hypothetical protein